MSAGAQVFLQCVKLDKNDLIDSNAALVTPGPALLISNAEMVHNTYSMIIFIKRLDAASSRASSHRWIQLCDCKHSATKLPSATYITAKHAPPQISLSPNGSSLGTDCNHPEELETF